MTINILDNYICKWYDVCERPDGCYVKNPHKHHGGCDETHKCPCFIKDGVTREVDYSCRKVEEVDLPHIVAERLEKGRRASNPE
jgi:hypothetical protein